MNDYINKVHKVIYDNKTGTITFIIQTDGDQDYWYWYLNEDTVRNYYKDHGDKLAYYNAIGKTLSREQAERFCNDFDNSDKGVSVASYDTIDEILREFNIL